MLSDITGGLVAYYLGIAIVAVPGLIGVLLLGRLHRATLKDCRKLQEEVSRAEQATGRIRSLMSDLVATMNLSLAFCAANPGLAHEREIEQIRLAVEEAIGGGRQTSDPASAGGLLEDTA
jgi:hypothetical protein